LRVVHHDGQLQRTRDIARDLVLQRQYVAELSVVALGPELGA
jgi:hypothetical protein